MIRLFLHFLLVLISFSLYTQSYNIQWGIAEKLNGNWNHTNLGWKDGYNYKINTETSSMNADKYQLRKYKNGTKLIFDKELKLKSRGFYFKYMFKDHIYFIQLAPDGLSMKKTILNTAKFDLGGRMLSSKSQSALNNLNKFGSDASANPYFILSPDKKKVGISFICQWESEGYAEIYNIVLDSDDPDNIQYFSNKISFDKYPDLLRLSDFSLTNNGSVVSLVRTLNKGEASRYKLYVMKNTGEFQQPIDMVYNQYNLGEVGFNSYDDYIILNGVISQENEKQNMIYGFFLAKLDIETNSIKNLNTFMYSNEFFGNLGYQLKKDGSVDFDGFYRFSKHADSKGGGYLVADHIFGHYYNKGSYETLIIPFDSEAKLGELILLPKNNHGKKETTEGVGVFPFVLNDLLYIVYNGLEENSTIHNYNDISQMKDIDKKNGAAYVAKIEPGKELIKNKLFEYKESDGYLLPNQCSADHENVLIKITNGKELRYGFLETDK